MKVRRIFEHYQKDADLILLDVEMPGMDGISLARRIRQDDKEVLLMFITNMAQYALHGYEVEAIDYVIKPLGYQEFALKMKKAMRYMGRHEKKQMMPADDRWHTAGGDRGHPVARLSVIICNTIRPGRSMKYAAP